MNMFLLFYTKHCSCSVHVQYSTFVNVRVQLYGRLKNIIYYESTSIIMVYFTTLHVQRCTRTRTVHVVYLNIIAITKVFPYSTTYTTTRTWTVQRLSLYVYNVQYVYSLVLNKWKKDRRGFKN